MWPHVCAMDVQFNLMEKHGSVSGTCDVEFTVGDNELQANAYSLVD